VLERIGYFKKKKSAKKSNGAPVRKS